MKNRKTKTAERPCGTSDQQHKECDNTDGTNRADEWLRLHLLVIEPWLGGAGRELPTASGGVNLGLRIEYEKQHE
jgi:hypothetical protein